MAPTCAYRFAIDIYAEDGRSLGTFFAHRDWEPVCDWTRLRFLRSGQLSLIGDGSTSVAPLWDDEAGEPFCRGFRVEIAEPGRPPVGVDFPHSHFGEYAALVASALVTQKRLQEGADYSYRLVAFPAAQNKEKAGGLQVVDASPALPVRPSLLADFRDRSRPAGSLDCGDMPVFVPPRILEEMAAQTHAHEGTETGGILIGTLWRDAGGAEIFLEITAQIPAEHTSGDQVKLTFTPQTWAAADAALRLRNRGEMFAGYWHSHPVKSWCRAKSCSLEAQKKCRLARDFFSADDVAVMRAAFPSAWCIAIVANDTAFADISFSMFGNREGMTQPRGYYVLEANAS